MAHTAGVAREGMPQILYRRRNPSPNMSRAAAPRRLAAFGGPVEIWRYSNNGRRNQPLWREQGDFRRFAPEGEFAWRIGRRNRASLRKMGDKAREGTFFRYRAHEFDASWRSQYSEIYHSLAGGRWSGSLRGVRSRKEDIGEF